MKYFDRRVVPKGTRLHQLHRVGGYDLGIYYHEDETHKWEEKIEQFGRLVELMREQLDRMVKMNNEEVKE
jgi:hypothetical protein